MADLFFEQLLFQADHGIGRNVLGYHASGANHAVVSDGGAFENRHIAADPAMLADYHRRRGIALAFDGFLLVGKTMIVIVHTYVLPENRFAADPNLLDGMHRAIVVEEDIVSDG